MPHQVSKAALLRLKGGSERYRKVFGPDTEGAMQHGALCEGGSGHQSAAREGVDLGQFSVSELSICA